MLKARVRVRVFPHTCVHARTRDSRVRLELMSLSRVCFQENLVRLSHAFSEVDIYDDSQYPAAPANDSCVPRLSRNQTDQLLALLEVINYTLLKTNTLRNSGRVLTCLGIARSHYDI